MRQADKQMKFINILLIALDNDRQQTFEDKRNGPGFWPLRVHFACKLPN